MKTCITAFFGPKVSVCFDGKFFKMAVDGNNTKVDNKIEWTGGLIRDIVSVG